MEEEVLTLPASGFPGERHIILESWADHTVTSCCFFAALFNDFRSSVMSFPAQSRTAVSDCPAAKSTERMRLNRAAQPCLSSALHSMCRSWHSKCMLRVVSLGSPT